jgi:cyclopropane-fatty-acyl-phospholipid synthase
MALPRDEPESSADKALTRSAHLSGQRHSTRRDREAVRFHYNVGNAFYGLWLDAKMVYSCAYFARETDDLDQAQESKLEHICRKLRLTPGERLLDIGCGWGGLIMHAARRYGVFALGITLSDAQAETARERIAAAGLGDRCHVELRDYRQLAREPRFDKISSVGMVEHVGAQRLDDYFASAWGALRPGGLFLNHGIVSIAASRPESRWSRVAGRVWKRGAFIDRYVFPDGELVPAATVIASAEKAGFELRDVESLREHYVQTLRHWVHRLESRHDEAIALVGEPTYRVWRLYMSASAYGFRTGRIGIIQSLLAKPYADGKVELPRTREDLYVRASRSG